MKDSLLESPGAQQVLDDVSAHARRLAGEAPEAPPETSAGATETPPVNDYESAAAEAQARRGNATAASVQAERARLALPSGRKAEKLRKAAAKMAKLQKEMAETEGQLADGMADQESYELLAADLQALKNEKVRCSDFLSAIRERLATRIETGKEMIGNPHHGPGHCLAVIADIVANERAIPLASERATELGKLITKKAAAVEALALKLGIKSA